MVERILQYYDECRRDYAKYWRTDQHLSMHMGYTNLHSPHQSHNTKVEQMITFLAQLVEITSEDSVVDLGCGYGGSAYWLAEHYRCQVTGIDINPQHIRGARLRPVTPDTAGRTSFYVGDMERIGAPYRPSVVWSLEAACYAQNKRTFLHHLYRGLRSGGRLVIADGFQRKEHPILQKWLDTWAVPNLATVPQFAKWLTEAGFVDVTYRNITENVKPSSDRLYRMALLRYPMAKLLERIGRRSKIQTGNVVGAIYQHKVLTKGLAEYGVFTARKP